MKKSLVLVIALVMVFALLAGCGGSGGGPSIAGTWVYEDTEAAMSSIYVLNEDSTGTYTIKVEDQEVVYELKYEVQDGHLLVTYVNNDVFSEDDVFDSEFSFQDDNTLIIKDSFGEEMTYIRQ